jgi:hypothetical protein
MYIKDEKIEDIRISNRRHDDIVIIIKHDFQIESKKNHILIEYINDYGCKFFNTSKEKIFNTLEENYKPMQFSSILSQKTKHTLNDSLAEESEDNFETHDLAGIMRKIPHFTVLNGNHEPVLVSIKIFHLKQENHIIRNKQVNSMHYYLIIRSATFDMKIAEYRMQFLEKIGSKITLDPLTNIHNFQSTIDELKMVIKYENSHKDINIVIAIIEVNKSLNDNVITTSIVNNFMRSTRVEDFIGHFGEHKLLMIFYDIDLERAEKPLKRLYNIVLSDKYVYDKYRNQRNDVISIGFTKLTKGDDIDTVQKRLELAIKNNESILNNIKISSI